MKKILLSIAVLITAMVLVFSFSFKKFIYRQGSEILGKQDTKNKEALLSLSKNYEKKKDYLRARETLKEFIKKFPDSEDATNAAGDIENLNIKILFSSAPTDDSFQYEIKTGDSLAKIAARNGTTTELLKKSNALKTDLILPGKFLKVTKTKFNILVDKSDNILCLQSPAGQIIKKYTVATGENYTTPAGKFVIEEKLVSPVWYKVGASVDPASPEYELGSRWMGLSVAGYGIHGTKDPSTIGMHVTKGCVRMRNEDVEELYAIVPSGTEVTIVE